MFVYEGTFTLQYPIPYLWFCLTQFKNEPWPPTLNLKSQTGLLIMLSKRTTVHLEQDRGGGGNDEK